MTFPFKFSRRRALVIHLLLAFSLLLSQSAAYAHIYSHLTSPNTVSDPAGVASQLCSQCLEGAPLLGAAGLPEIPTLSARAPAGFAPAAFDVDSRPDQAPHFAFRSRAPPELL